jgi:hypothetical protein
MINMMIAYREYVAPDYVRFHNDNQFIIAALSPEEDADITRSFKSAGYTVLEWKDKIHEDD